MFQNVNGNAEGVQSLTDGAGGAWAESPQHNFLSAMSVILFPPSRSRPAGGAPFRLLRPTLALTPDDVELLTQQDFFEVIHADPANGTAVIHEDDEMRLVQYLEFHGLRLPSAVDANQLRELCNTLRWTFGQAVRLAVHGGIDLVREFPGLNAEKIAYVHAVASQDHALVRDKARLVFKDRASTIFLY